MNRDAVVTAVLAACLALAGCQGLPGSGPGDVESAFDDGTEGWKVVGDAQDGSADPTHNSQGGDPGGYLSAEGWTNSETGEQATDTELGTVLANLERLWIRGEYRTGSDTGGLDTVVLRGP
ncbi:MAG: laminin B domain-containing protein [Haloarculaceae archaeon]